MIDAPSSTWFTASPHWSWLIVAHFSLSGLAGGTYFLATMIDLTRQDEDDRRLARLGYYMALPILLMVSIILIVDLSRPDRFWHMLVANHTLWPMFKWWAPMSVGSWGVSLLGFFALLSFLAAFAGHARPQWRFLASLRPPGFPGWLVAVPGALAGLLVTGYTGVMLSVLNRPIWSDTALFGMLFLISAVTMAAALLVLGAHGLRWLGAAVDSLRRMLAGLLILQIIVWLSLLLSLGPAARGWLNLWGVALAVGILAGVVLPLFTGLRGRGSPSFRGAAGAAALVLAGGVVVRMAIVFVPDASAP